MSYGWQTMLRTVLLPECLQEWLQYCRRRSEVQVQKQNKGFRQDQSNYFRKYNNCHILASQDGDQRGLWWISNAASRGNSYAIVSNVNHLTVWCKVNLTSNGTRLVAVPTTSRMMHAPSTRCTRTYTRPKPRYNGRMLCGNTRQDQNMGWSNVDDTCNIRQAV